jgi:aldehyde dehydrogenase (NAD+)
MASVIPDDPSVIGEKLQILRQSVAENLHRPVEVRIEQLKRFKAALMDNMDNLCEATLKDLGRDKYTTSFLEFGTLFNHLDLLIAKCSSWYGPVAVDTPMMTGPGSSYIINEPYGVALVIGAWNYPVVTTINPLLGAIAAGNATMTKPSELSPHSSKAIAKVIQEALDPKLHQVVEGGAQVAMELLRNKWDLIVFTGSPIKGKLVLQAAAEHLTPTILELGGKCPVVVDSGCDIRNAALRIGHTKFMNAG